jgi:uncharacterized membrane-anchored protein
MELRMRRYFTVILSALLFAFFAVIASAEVKPLTDDERNVIWTAAEKASINGPQDVPLGDQAKLHLPENYVYIPKAQAAEVMRMWGNSTGDTFHGLVFPKSNTETWTIVIDHIAGGYVKDDDAKTWNADELLQSLKDGTEAQNEDRLNLGLAALDVAGWVQKPEYDASKHQLVWSLKAVKRGAPADEPSTINYNTYALGRDGYFEVDLLTTDKTVASDKASALKIVSAVDYNSGKKYADFNAATDHIAEYGLAALVAGVAAKKLGLLAVAGVFLAKFAKIIIAALAVGGGSLFKIFRRKPTPPSDIS